MILGMIGDDFQDEHSYVLTGIPHVMIFHMRFTTGAHMVRSHECW